ncbi:MAG: hypothetical protein ACI89U_002606, partial [Gammaproteobacteria bacterium]
ESQLRSSENALNNHLLWLENLEVKIQRAEAALVSDGLNRHQRKQILSDLKQLGADMVDAEYDFLALENQMLDDQDFVREIRERYGY